MVFSSPVFLFLFLPVVLFGYHLLPGRARNGWLLAASLVFYAWGEPYYVVLMLASIGMNYRLGRSVVAADEAGAGRIVRWAVVLNLGLLAVFKYSSFAVANLNLVLGAGGVGAVVPDPGIALPVGISFFTFQALSYVVDVRRRDAEPARSLGDLALYVALFPQLIAGPIVRYRDVADQIAMRRVALADLAIGIERFVLGLAKKVLLANTFAVAADGIFALPAGDLPVRTAWFGVGCYTLQIYFDFSGYSDMAIGLGRMFGFRFLENFRYPYVAQSVREFWRRWHISLSTWFQDYLYVPLGGSRGGPVVTYRNLLVVFLLCGLWHGASWSFVVWGLFHGSFLVLERLGLARVVEAAPRPVRHAYVMVVVMVGWVFFRASSLEGALGYLGAMAGGNGGGDPAYRPGIYLSAPVRVALGLGLIGSTPVVPALRAWLGGTVEGGAVPVARVAGQVAYGLSVLALYAASGCVLAGATHNPFLYFRF